jgi:opacity protein-like surface antigen
MAALCLGERAAHAQAAPVQYLNSPFSLGEMFKVDPNTNRYNFSNGWFVGSERSSMGFSSLAPAGVGNFGPLSSQGVQFGYTFQNAGAPVTFFAGFDNLKSNTGMNGFFTNSQSAAGFGTHAGVEFKPTSNVSLSLGMGFTQLNGRTDTDTTSPIISNDSQLGLLGIRPQ